MYLPAAYYFLVWVRLLRHHQLHPNPDHIAGQAVQLPDFCVPGTGADLLLRDLPQVVLRRDGVHLLADAIEVLLLPAHIGKYLKGIPADSRVGRGETWIGNELNDKMIEKLNKLNDIAASRGQTLSQMALSWVLHNKAVTTVLIGASRPEQITENIGCLDRLDFTEAELAEINKLAKM